MKGLKRRGPQRRTIGRQCHVCGTTDTPEWRRGPNSEIRFVFIDKYFSALLDFWHTKVNING